MPTSVSVFEYNAGQIPVTGTVSQSVRVDRQNIWNSCVEALQSMTTSGQIGYKSKQTGKSVAKPGHWSGPATNLGANAQNTKWKSAYNQQPHVHLGNAQLRAVIGCVLTDNGSSYLTMNIYIGQEG